MNRAPFDALSRPLATTRSRRAIPGRLGGQKVIRCQGELRAQIPAQGGGPPLELGGTLTLDVGQFGSIGAGDLMDVRRGSIPVVGQAKGRDVGLLFSLDDGSVVTADAVADEGPSEGFGHMLGVITAWSPDDSQRYALGTWSGARFAAVDAATSMSDLARSVTMDPSRLDALSRSLATATPRRLLLGHLARGGVAVMGALGLTRRQVAARQDSIQQCVGVFRARTDAPSDAPPLELDGELTLEIGPSGSVDAGTLVDRTLGSIPVQGTVFGRRVSLLFTLGEDQRRLAAGGTAENEVFQCQGGMYGTFVVAGADVEAQPGELGSWAFVA